MLRLTLLAAWVWSWPLWLRVGLSLALVAATVGLLRLTPPITRSRQTSTDVWQTAVSVDDRGPYVPTQEQPHYDRGPEREIVFVVVKITNRPARHNLMTEDMCALKAIPWDRRKGPAPEWGPFLQLNPSQLNPSAEVRNKFRPLPPEEAKRYFDAVVRAAPSADIPPGIVSAIQSGPYDRRRLCWPQVGQMASTICISPQEG